MAKKRSSTLRGYVIGLAMLGAVTLYGWISEGWVGLIVIGVLSAAFGSLWMYVSDGAKRRAATQARIAQRYPRALYITDVLVAPDSAGALGFRPGERLYRAYLVATAEGVIFLDGEGAQECGRVSWGEITRASSSEEEFGSRHTIQWGHLHLTGDRVVSLSGDSDLAARILEAKPPAAGPVFWDTESPLSAEDLRAVEDVVGPLPDSLRRHYAVANGGVPSARVFRSGDVDRTEYYIDSFFPMRHPPHEDVHIEDLHRELVEEGSLPAEYIPFAEDLGENLFVLARSDESIHYWRRNSPPQDIRRLADSLDDFLARLRTS